MADSIKPQMPTLLKLPKWPFLVGDALLVGVAAWIIFQNPARATLQQNLLCVSAIALAALLGALPFILEYRALINLLEADRLAGAVEQIKKIESLAAQITGATSLWSEIQNEASQTAALAKKISGEMAAEVADFTEFLAKANDSEKKNLRLEVEKFHRAENEWLQILVRILDQTFALQQAAVHSGKPGVAEQIARFQSTCYDIARRVGLAPFTAAPDEPFDTKRHRLQDSKAAPADGRVAGTIAPGYTFRGELLRPALVALQTGTNGGPALTGNAASVEKQTKPVEQSLL